jgi:hypothetical protein
MTLLFYRVFMNVLTLAREVQSFSAQQLSPDGECAYTDVEQWKVMQTCLVRELAELEGAETRNPEEEGELVLALLMGYCVAVRNGTSVQRALERAERVMPLLDDGLLKCRLAVHCCLEVPDEKLMEETRALLEKLKRQGKYKEIEALEKLIP